MLGAGTRGDAESSIRSLKAQLAEDAAALSRQRRAAAGRLRVAVESCLADLAMAGSRFDVRISWEPNPKASAAMIWL